MWKLFSYRPLIGIFPFGYVLKVKLSRSFGKSFSAVRRTSLSSSGGNLAWWSLGVHLTLGARSSVSPLATLSLPSSSIRRLSSQSFSNTETKHHLISSGVTHLPSPIHIATKLSQHARKAHRPAASGYSISRSSQNLGTLCYLLA